MTEKIEITFTARAPQFKFEPDTAAFPRLAAIDLTAIAKAIALAAQYESSFDTFNRPPYRKYPKMKPSVRFKGKS